MILYVVFYMTGEDDDNLIAIYSTREKAENRIKKYMLPSALYIDEVTLDED